MRPGEIKVIPAVPRLLAEFPLEKGENTYFLSIR